MVSSNGKVLSVLALSILALFAFGAAFRTSTAFTAPPEPWNQCPAVGNDVSCQILIVINPDGSVSIYQSATQGPFDGIEDTLVGVQDNCPGCGPISSIPISATSGTSPPIFGFDGDGACSEEYTPNPPAADCQGGTYQFSDPGDYESNNVTFSSISSDENSGTVNFSPGLTNGEHAWFSLENDISASIVTVTTTISTTSVSSSSTTVSGVPQFGSPAIYVAVIGFIGLTLLIRMKKSPISLPKI